MQNTTSNAFPGREVIVDSHPTIKTLRIQNSDCSIRKANVPKVNATILLKMPRTEIVTTPARVQKVKVGVSHTTINLLAHYKR
jgi:hypothetical protein